MINSSRLTRKTINTKIISIFQTFEDLNTILANQSIELFHYYNEVKTELNELVGEILKNYTFTGKKKDKSVRNKDKSVANRDKSVAEKDKSVVNKEKSFVEKDKPVADKSTNKKEKPGSMLTMSGIIKKDGSDSMTKKLTSVRKQTIEKSVDKVVQHKKSKSNISLMDPDTQNDSMVPDTPKSSHTEIQMPKSLNDLSNTGNDMSITDIKNKDSANLPSNFESFIKPSKRTATMTESKRKASTSITKSVQDTSKSQTRRSTMSRLSKFEPYMPPDNLPIQGNPGENENAFRASISKYMHENAEENKLLLGETDNNFRSYLVDIEDECLFGAIDDELNPIQLNPAFHMNPSPSPNRDPRSKLMMIRPLKEFINDFLTEKKLFDQIGAAEWTSTRSSAEMFLFHYLKKKYGLPDLVMKHALLIIDSVKHYAGIDYKVALFDYVA